VVKSGWLILTQPKVMKFENAAWRHRLRIVVPITSWQARFAKDFWMVEIIANTTNGLNNNSAANTFQIKSVSEQRFARKLGELTPAEMEEISAAVALCIGFEPTI
jgi:mRNA interferase MazF